MASHDVIRSVSVVSTWVELQRAEAGGGRTHSDAQKQAFSPHPPLQSDISVSNKVSINPNAEQVL